MNRNLLIGGIVVVLVVAIGLGYVFYSGIGPAPGGSDSGETISDFPTETTADQETTTQADEAVPPFSFTIDEIETCGQTCRDVTATVTNNQNETATGVTVYTRIFAGQNNTDSDDMVWEGKENVGTLEAEGAHTSTTRVELSLQDGQKINKNDGWITILTTVESDETTVTFQDSDQVA